MRNALVDATFYWAACLALPVQINKPDFCQLSKNAVKGTGGPFGQIHFLPMILYMKERVRECTQKINLNNPHFITLFGL